MHRPTTGLLCALLIAWTALSGAQEAPLPQADSEAATGVREPVDEPVDDVRRYGSRVSLYEPMYLSTGWRDHTNAKIQLSFKYRFLNPEGGLAKSGNWFNLFHFGYTQTSLWDLGADSAPFYDTSYKPSLFFMHERIGRWSRPGRRVGLVTGIEHESNGKGGAESRSLNIVYLRPTFAWEHVLGGRLTLAPKVYGYFGGLSDNRDLVDYRGYVDLDLALELPDSWKIATTLRKGTVSSYGSVQVDVSYPLDRVFTGSFNAFMHLQYFNGWGESLLSYNQKHPAQLRIGIMIAR